MGNACPTLNKTFVDADTKKELAEYNRLLLAGDNLSAKPFMTSYLSAITSQIRVDTQQPLTNKLLSPIMFLHEAINTTTNSPVTVCLLCV
jgi:hypothetical protein